ncbi:ATP-binding cassette domain-containing protein, partial [Bacillus sp. S34]|nr:ATP-binding cassette domain-containing protein [Bacillus sp. S34]
PVKLPDATGKMDFDDVVFAYNAGKVVLPEFDLHIPAGQTIALVGSTGAGKSTLVNALTGSSRATGVVNSVT